jgi:hypothetical protein
MSNKNTYGRNIDEKFRELSFPDMDTTWPGMKDLLDQEMPRKRFLGWFNWTSALALLLVAFSVTTIVTFINFNIEANKADAIVKAKAQSEAPASANHRTTVSKLNTHENTNTSVANLENTTEPSNELQPATKKKSITQAAEKLTVNTAVIVDGNKVTKQTNQSHTDIATAALNSKNRAVAKNNSGNTINSKASTQQTAIITTGAGVKNASANSNSIRTSTQVQADIAAANVNAKNASAQNNTSGQTNFESKLSSNTRSAVSPIAMTKKSVQLKKPTAIVAANPFNTDSTSSIASKHAKKVKGWVAGVAINYNLPVSNQEMSTVNINGKKSTLIDFLPSIYVQYHLNEKWYFESSLQFSSPQYIANHKLAASYTAINANKKEENALWLNKLYYLNIPVSVHFNALPNLSIGTGLQYSYLRRSIFADELATWEKGSNGWTKTASEKTIAVKSNAAAKKEKANNGNGNGNGGNGNGGNGNGGNGNGGNGNGGNGNGGNGNGGNGNGGNGGSTGGGTTTTPAPMAPIDTVAQTLKSTDLRWLLDVNYRWKRINMGASFNLGLNNYIDIRSGNNILPVKDRNQALQIYLRYDLFDQRRKH